MPKLSAGIVVVRVVDGAPEFLLVHPGGPFWKNKDDGAWSIPKGEHEPGDDPLLVALREFEEELGTALSSTDLRPLGTVKQRGGKTVSAWCTFGDLDVTVLVSNTFEMEWPPRSGRTQQFPEVDRAAWFPIDIANVKILASQRELLDRVVEALDCG